MQVSIIIVSWKVKELVRQCLQSIFKQTTGVDFEVILVDNASGDGTVEMVAKEFPQVNLIASNVNLGFAAGNNLGIEQVSGEVIYLLNPDTELADNALADLLAYMNQNPSAGVVGTRLLNPDGSQQQSVRRFPGLGLALLWVLKVQHLLPNLPVFRNYLAADFDYDIAQTCDQVMGASMAIRRRVLEAVGRLDERYFIWFEEVDYCRMATAAGFQVWYTPAATVVHHGGESFRQVAGLTNQRRFNASLRQYARKHFGGIAWFILWLLNPLSLALAWLAGRRKR
jgi:GT2 family glycosyltransferase